VRHKKLHPRTVDLPQELRRKKLLQLEALTPTSASGSARPSPAPRKSRCGTLLGIMHALQK